MEPRKHIIIFSHGFGVRKDGRGLLTSIVNIFPDAESILFDYNEYNNEQLTLTVSTLTEQAEKLNSVIAKAREDNRGVIIDIVAHSQGCLVTSIVKPGNIRKTIFIAPSFDDNMDRLLSYFEGRPGTMIDKEGITKLPRRDGTTTIVPAKFWAEREKFVPIYLYNEFSKLTDLTIINALQDEVLVSSDTNALDKKIKIIELDGSHDFGGDARESLLKEIKTIINS